MNVHAFFQKLVYFDQTEIANLNISSERPSQELLNVCFSFEIGHSKLKLWALKVTHYSLTYKLLDPGIAVQ